MSASEKKILSRLRNYDLQGRSLDTRGRAQKARAQDIKRAVNMVDEWLKLGCVVIYAAGKVYAAKGGFRGEIDIAKGVDRGLDQYARSIANSWHTYGEIIKNRFRPEPYDAVIEEILNEML